MNKALIAFASLVLLLSIASFASAHCPLCTGAAAGAVAAARFYGVDDAIVGVWLGAFIISTALWFDRILKKRYIPMQTFSIIILALVMTLVPFYFAGLFGGMHKTLFGIDRLFVGIVSGSILTYLGFILSNEIKKENKKVLFPFQSIILTFAILLIASLMFWLVAV
ncbi:MAG: hypothetical protein AB1467_02995 [Candidatus Diapherotrites archaeon]